jgi:hypothetical protein
MEAQVTAEIPHAFLAMTDYSFEGRRIDQIVITNALSRRADISCPIE